MAATGKKYVSGGFVSDHEYHLDGDKRTALKLISLDDSDLLWLEDQMTLYNIAVADSGASPTPAEVRAALVEGKKALGAFLSWLGDADSVTAGHMRMAAYEHGMNWRRFNEIRSDLSYLSDLIEIARRRVGAPKAGRIEKDSKLCLAIQIVGRFRAQGLAYKVLTVMLPGLADATLHRLIGKARRT